MKVAVVASGWHFPLHFFEAMAKQRIPTGWSVDMFCVSHRDPQFSAQEKQEYLSKLGWSYREMFDRLLYSRFATVEDIERLGWTYMLEPNTIGDMGNVNQWLDKYDYRNYDVILITHDDNVILNDRLYTDLLAHDPQWLVLTNAAGPGLSWRNTIKHWRKPIEIRGSFEFFKKEVLDMIGGKFDLSSVSLTREGETTSGQDTSVLKDWNNTTRPLQRSFEKNNMTKKIVPLSNTYRVSDYCIEGERGYISYTQKENTALEEKGFRRLQQWRPHAQ